jgi:hypothetical protein
MMSFVNSAKNLFVQHSSNVTSFRPMNMSLITSAVTPRRFSEISKITFFYRRIRKTIGFKVCFNMSLTRAIIFCLGPWMVFCEIFCFEIMKSTANSILFPSLMCSRATLVSLDRLQRPQWCLNIVRFFLHETVCSVIAIKTPKNFKKGTTAFISGLFPLFEMQ